MNKAGSCCNNPGLSSYPSGKTLNTSKCPSKANEAEVGNTQTSAFVMEEKLTMGRIKAAAQLRAGTSIQEGIKEKPGK